MAEEVIRIELGGSGGQAKSLQDLKKEYKDLQTELSKTKAGSDEYIQTLKKLGATKDEIGDLRDTISALNPEGKVAAFAKVGSTIASGFAAAQGAAALFGAESEELQKTMLKVQAAMALAEGIKGITAAGDAFAVLNTVMKANPILAIVAGFTALTAVVATLYNNYKDANSVSAELEANHQKLKESTASLTKSIDVQIQSLKGLKANDEQILELTEKKLKANILLEQSSLRVALAKQAEQEAEFNYNEQVLRLAGKNAEADTLRAIRTKEARDATNTAIESLKASIAGLSQFQNEQHQKEIDANQKVNDEKAKSNQKYLDDKKAADQKAFDDMFAQLLQEQQIIAEHEKFKRKESEETWNKKQEEMFLHKQLEDQMIAEVEANGKKAADDEVKLEKEKNRAKMEIAAKSIEATKAFTDLYFSHQLRQAKGNAEKEKEIKKKQFQVDKAFKVASIILNTIQGITQAIASSPPPLSWVLAGINSAIGTAATIAALSQKFDDGGSATGVGDIGGASLGGGAAAPAVPQPNNTVTKIDDEGKVNKMQQPVVKAVVVETDITDKQNRINTIEESAKFG